MPIKYESRIFNLKMFVREADFESVVKELADEIFGSSTIYIDVKKRVHGKDIVTIPDAYLIDMTIPNDPQLFVIENEIVSHDPFQHIGIQLLKFATNFEEGKYSIRNFLMESISKNPEMMKRLRAGSKKSDSRNIDNYLDRAVFGDFKAIVLIDDARPELHNVLQKIYADISVLELKRFHADRNQLIYQYDTLYGVSDEGEIEGTRGRTEKKELRRKKRERRAQSDTIVVPAREEGFREVFLGENAWYEIRIGAAMKKRIKYIAAYQTAPVSAVTYIAEIQDIRPYKNTGRYIVTFKGKAKRIKKIPIKNSRMAPQAPVYVKKETLLKSKSLDEALL